MSEKTTEQQPSANARERRRAFLKRSAGPAAFGLVLSTLFDDASVAEAQRRRISSPRDSAPVEPPPPGPSPDEPAPLRIVQAGTYTITDKQAARLNAIRVVFRDAMATGNVKVSLAKHGKGLTSRDRQALATLTRGELTMLRRIHEKLKIIDSDIAGDNGGGTIC